MAVRFWGVSFFLLTLVAWGGRPATATVIYEDSTQPVAKSTEGECLDCCDDDCGCLGGGCCGSAWTFYTDALFYTRSKPKARTLLVNGAFAPLYDANEITFPTQMGWDIGAIGRINCCWAAEFKYSDFGGQAARSPEFVGTNGAGVPYRNRALGIFGADATSTVSDSSRLQNVELNARRCVCDWMTVLVGIRYVSLNDRILIAQESATLGAEAVQHIQGLNDMVGLQLGADVAVWRWNCFHVDGLIKAGVYDDRAQNRFSYSSVYFQEDVRTGTGVNRTSFLGELGVTAAYDFCNCWSIRGGYQLMWVDGIALAPGQPSVNSLPTVAAATNVQTTGDVFYHGAFVGVEYRR